VRRLTCALLFLLAGAACTVLVAWACAYLRLGGRPGWDHREWPTDLGQGTSGREEFRWDWVGGSTRSLTGFRPSRDSDGEDLRLTRTEAGLPVRALVGDEFFQVPNPSVVLRRDGIVIMSDGRRLPTRVIWPGFLADTAFYAAVLAALILVPRRLRRHLRRRAGRCTRCGYDRRGIDAATPCPECGVAPHPA
jgi:hypothetical protein